MTTRFENEWANTYGSMGSKPAAQLMQLPLSILDPWTDKDGNPQPFKPYSEAQLADLANNIRQHGILEPINCRPKDGRFQIIAGHNRCNAARLAGLETIPALVEDMPEEDAARRMADSNLLHRPSLLPSEKAWAYRIRLENTPSRQGQRTDLTSTPLEAKYRRDELLGESLGDSREQVRRYIRLTYCIPAILELVDAKHFPFRSAVEIGYLEPEAQQLLMDVLREYDLPAPKTAMAVQIRRAAEEQPLDQDTILQILCPEEPEEEETDILELSIDRLRKYFPEGTADAAMEDQIYKALAAYFRD